MDDQAAKDETTRLDQSTEHESISEPGADPTSAAGIAPDTAAVAGPARNATLTNGTPETTGDDTPTEALSAAAVVGVASALLPAEPAIEPSVVPDSPATPPQDKALVPGAPAPPLAPVKPAKPGSVPLTRSTSLVLLLAGLAALATAALLGLALTQGDWGTGARAAGLASLVLGVICLLGIGMRSLVWRRRVAWGGIAFLLICGLFGGSALAAANPLRLAEGHRLEAARDWPGALRAYLLAGEDGPASEDPARVYVEWGDALANQGEYASAIDRYEQAISRYPHAAREAPRAIVALWPAYSAWLASPSASLPYLAMIQSLHGYQHSAWCASACLASAAALEAQTRFAYGQELAAERQYAQAVTYLQSVATTDPTSLYVARAHAVAATAYYALGQSEQRGPHCATALPAFQALATTYRDTPEGHEAAAALAAPVQVSGRLTGYPTYPTPTMYLSINVYSVSHFSDDYSATLDGSGNFTFTQVKAGAYNLSAAFGDGSGRYWQDAKTSNPYAVAVAPLCAVNLGTYSW